MKVNSTIVKDRRVNYRRVNSLIPYIIVISAIISTIINTIIIGMVITDTNVETWLLKYAAAAKEAGVSKDQLMNFLKGGYVAQPHQLRFHAAARSADNPDGPDLIGYGGCRGPGKTHAVFAQIALDDCQRFPGIKFLFLRKMLKAGKESFDDVRRKVLFVTPYEYKSRQNIVEFPNRSRIILGHFRSENDIDHYLGIEYDGVVIEEATQLSKQKVEMIRGSVRSTVQHWRPRIYMTTNPGGIGHQWFRTQFILPYRAGTEKETKFIPASGDQNIYLNPEYKRWLKNLGGTLGRMWRDGDWDIAGGAYFTNWNYSNVVIPPLVNIPDHWPVWLSMDYGFQHWCQIYLFAKNDDGIRIIVDELSFRRTLIPDIVRSLNEMLQFYHIHPQRIRSFVAGHDVFSKESNGKSVADQFADFGWDLQPANTDRLNGAAEWLKALGDATNSPNIKITTRCQRLIECIPMMLSDPKRPEDVLKIDCDPDDGEGGDDPYDAARYGLMEDRRDLGGFMSRYRN